MTGFTKAKSALSRWFARPAVRHLAGTLVSVALSVTLSNYLSPIDAQTVGNAVGAAIAS